jgi:hypothetical protein
MIVTTYRGDPVAIIRVYSMEKWCKVILPDESVEWVRTADIAEEEIEWRLHG